jgi:hypothetical protein
MNQEQINHLNRFITHNEIEVATRSLPRKKSQDLMNSLLEFYQTFKEELIPTFLKLFHEIEREGTLTNLFYKASITLIPKSEDTTKERKLQANVFNEHVAIHRMRENFCQLYIRQGADKQNTQGTQKTKLVKKSMIQ